MGSTDGRQIALRACFLRFSITVIPFIPYCYAFSARYPWKYRVGHAQLAHGLILHERGNKSVICSIDDFFQVRREENDRARGTGGETETRFFLFMIMGNYCNRYCKQVLAEIF